MSKKQTSTKHQSTGIISETFAATGMTGLGNILLAETPTIIMAQAEPPSFPRFLTVSYIQNIVKTEILPILNEVLAAIGRLQNRSDMSLVVTIFEETGEIDKGEIYLLESAVRLSRAMLSMFCIYDFDIYSPDGSKDMRWIDDYVSLVQNTEEHEKLKFRLSRDTLYETCTYDQTQLSCELSDIISYNLTRNGFLTMQNNYFDAVYNDLKAVPRAIKNALSSIRAETDNQNDDILIRTDIIDLDADMASIQSDMLNEGISEDLAGKFSSPEALMDFISTLLTQPYTFNETIDSTPITIRVDLSKFFTNPAADLKTRWPKYKLVSGDNRIVSTNYEYSNWSSWRDSTIHYDSFYYDTVIMDIADHQIDSVYTSDWGYTTVILKNGYTTHVQSDSTLTCVPYKLIDDQ
ncbi:MAG: hypothetical protein GF401_17700 [Chitinivibrionales bacterium]|nr:hypothetical protein [Chitinivibrionales bacterium]